MKSKILILGRGYLGREYERHGFEVWGRDKFEMTPDFECTLEALHTRLGSYDTIVNCIGKSNTRWCEESRNFPEALLINGQLPGVLSAYCRQYDKKFVHISTGCLYDNIDKPNEETDFISAHCGYTVTKYAGEMYCNTNRDLILRPRLYFSDVADRNNLLSKLSKFSSYTNDAYDSFTCTSTIVSATKALLDNGQSGVFNVAQVGRATIAQIAHYCGLEVKATNHAEDLRKREGLYLVNNVMNIDKLMKYFRPADIKTSVKLSYAELIKS